MNGVIRRLKTPYRMKTMKKMGVDYWQMAGENRNATKVMTLYPEIKETQTLTKASSTSG